LRWGEIHTSLATKFYDAYYQEIPLINPTDPTWSPVCCTWGLPKVGGTIKLLSQPVKSRKPWHYYRSRKSWLNPYIEGVGPQAALEGFITWLCLPLGRGYPGNIDDGRNYKKKESAMKKCSKVLSRHDIKESQRLQWIEVVGFFLFFNLAIVIWWLLEYHFAFSPYYGGQPSADMMYKNILLFYTGHRHPM
jgi:hypothetical protein